jgi:hypothetical protein
MTDHRGRPIRLARLRQQTKLANKLPTGRSATAMVARRLRGKTWVVDGAEGSDEREHSTIAGSPAPMHDATSIVVAAEPLIRGD